MKDLQDRINPLNCELGRYMLVFAMLPVIVGIYAWISPVSARVAIKFDKAAVNHLRVIKIADKSTESLVQNRFDLLD